MKNWIYDTVSTYAVRNYKAKKFLKKCILKNYDNIISVVVLTEISDLH